MWREIKQVINKHQRFVITTHVNPDGDGLGASCALIELLCEQGKEVRFLCDGVIPSKFSFLNSRQLFFAFDSSMDLSDIEVLFVLDTHSKARIGALATLAESPSLFVVCVDHHPLTETFADINVIDSHACSVGAMIYTLYKECGYALSHQAAMGVYTSVICDTGRFSYASTSRKAHKIADECLKIGVDPSWMYASLFQQVPLEHMLMFSRIIQDMEVHCEARVLVQAVRKRHLQELETTLNDFEYMHEFHKMTAGIECVMLLCELPDGYLRISLRSKTNFDVGVLMEEMGGGGHCKAAGAVVKGILEDVQAHLLLRFERAFQGVDLNGAIV